MKKLLFVLSGMLVTATAFGTQIFWDTFDSYSTGNLVGQGPWLQTGGTATSPIQVSAGRALLGNTGQDVNAPFSSPLTLTAGNSFYIGLTLNLSAAQGGDYFLHWAPGPTGNS